MHDIKHKLEDEDNWQKTNGRTKGVCVMIQNELSKWNVIRGRQQAASFEFERVQEQSHVRAIKLLFIENLK